MFVLSGRGGRVGILRSGSALVFGLGELNLHAVDAVHAVDEEDKDEYECNLGLALVMYRVDGGCVLFIPSGHIVAWRL